MKAQYPIRVQAIHSRGRDARFFIAVPAALAAAIGLKKGETVQWSLTDKNTLTVNRVHQKKKPTPVKKAGAKKNATGKKSVPVKKGAEAKKRTAGENAVPTKKSAAAKKRMAKRKQAKKM